mmetsp:Transcript_14074/g.30566  ORF Transcript_14074/g.30566 Transcript_14074/m.30566 type:complete len:371 (+) Transcript_14074:256-1368(+)
MSAAHRPQRLVHGRVRLRQHQTVQRKFAEQRIRGPVRQGPIDRREDEQETAQHLQFHVSDFAQHRVFFLREVRQSSFVVVLLPSRQNLPQMTQLPPQLLPLQEARPEVPDDVRRPKDAADRRHFVRIHPPRQARHLPPGVRRVLQRVVDEHAPRHEVLRHLGDDRVVPRPPRPGSGSVPLEGGEEAVESQHVAREAYLSIEGAQSLREVGVSRRAPGGVRDGPRRPLEDLESLVGGERRRAEGDVGGQEPVDRARFARCIVGIGRPFEWLRFSFVAVVGASVAIASGAAVAVVDASFVRFALEEIGSGMVLVVGGASALSYVRHDGLFCRESKEIGREAMPQKTVRPGVGSKMAMRPDYAIGRILSLVNW